MWVADTDYCNCGPRFDNWDRRHRSKRNSYNRVLIIRSPVIRNYVLFSTTNSRGNSSAKFIMQPTSCGKGLGLEKWRGDGSNTIKDPLEFADCSLSLSCWPNHYSDFRPIDRKTASLVNPSGILADFYLTGWTKSEVLLSYTRENQNDYATNLGGFYE